MVRICIAGFFGWNNCGDEGILQAIIDDLGWSNEYIIQTSLPFTKIHEYYVPNVTDIRKLDDGRTDFDVFLLGGGKVDWGFGWTQIFNVIRKNIPVMAYGVSLRTDETSEKLNIIYGHFLRLFSAITVRDIESKYSSALIDTVLSMCPAINLKEEKCQCPENMIAVCPRYLDYDSNGISHNEEQIDWIVKEVENEPENVLLIPFAPKDREGKLLDLEVCNLIAKKLNYKCQIMNVDPYQPKRVKYAISKSKRVISGGRYHALVWATAHNIPFKIFPNFTGIAKRKIDGFLEMYEKYGIYLKELEHRNKETFKRLMNETVN